MAEAVPELGGLALGAVGAEAGVDGLCATAGGGTAPVTVGSIVLADGRGDVVATIDDALACTDGEGADWEGTEYCHQSAAAPTIGITSTARDTAHTVGARNGWWVSSAC